MTTTTKLALELLANAPANQTLANTTFAQLNQLVQAGVVDRTNAPPGSPANEALYIITATATGAWAGKENQLAYWLTATGVWQYIVPREGFLCHVNDEDLFYKFDGSAWGAYTGGGIANPMTTAGDIIVGGVSGAPARLAMGSALQQMRVNAGGTALEYFTPPSSSGTIVMIPVACSDEATALTTGSAKVTFINPFSSTFTVTAVVASLTTPQTSGSVFTVDINEAGVSILSTKLTIDNAEKNSSTAATAAVISDASIAAFAELTIDIDQVGDGTAKGLKVYLIGTV